MQEPLVPALHEVPVAYLFLIPLFPLIGAAINATLGATLQARVGRWVVHTIALSAVFASLAVATVAIWEVATAQENAVLAQRLWTWIAFQHPGLSLSIPFAFSVDRLTAVMLFVVTFVGSLIHVFSTGYMQDEKPYWRFFAWMNLFMFAMLTLVMGDSLLMMFVGWEGVGLCSYLLISYYYEEPDKAAAGMKAFVVNRIGDFAFIVGMALLLWAMVGTWQDGRFVADAAAQGPTLVFREIEARMHDDAFREAFLSKTVFGVPVVTLACILFFFGACGKSAQIPLYVWLPDAMAGPTPVSALIHAATMVTAGVYMVARLNFLYVHSQTAMTVVATVGALTALFAATIGFFQTDIKKVLAYSTVSQLGYMFVGVGVGAFSAGIFHLMTHAFFKACLFLGSGSIIYALHHRQDLKDMGGLRRVLPATYWTFLASTLAIAGIPGTSGFFSKDEILWRAFDNAQTLVPGEVIWALGAVAAMFTAFYMTRLAAQTFFGTTRADEHTLHHAKEYRRMTVPLWILAALALVGGFVGVPQALGGSNRFEHFLEPVFAWSAERLTWLSEEAHGTGLHSHAGEYLLMAVAVALALAGIAAAVRIYREYRSPEDEARLVGAGLHRVVFNKYYVDEGYWAGVVRPFLALTRVAGAFDKAVIDGLVNLCGHAAKVTAWINGGIDRVFVDGTVNLLATAAIETGQRVRRIQTGRLQAYVTGIVIGLSGLAVLAYVLAR